MCQLAVDFIDLSGVPLISSLATTHKSTNSVASQLASDFPSSRGFGFRTMKSADSCWTCRVRRKRCDREYPVCLACAELRITCHSSSSKPAWMDGSVKQEEMTKQIKREVRNNAPRRGHERAVHALRLRTALAEPEQMIEESPATPREQLSLPLSLPQRSPEYQVDRVKEVFGPSSHRSGSASRCALLGSYVPEQLAVNESDSILLMFYLDNLFPFWYPFYKPDPLERGGRAWILKMIISSPMLRQVTLCQASYFFSLAQGISDHGLSCESALSETGNAFGMLKHAVSSLIDGSSSMDNLHGAIRILNAIIQLQRFEIAMLSFENCHSHLSAAVALFQQLLNSLDGPDMKAASKLDALVKALKPPSWTPASQFDRLPSTEQAAFHFSAALLIFDDIVASTILQQQPRLYEYHEDLLNNVQNEQATVDLGAVVGCQNWVLLMLGKICALDAWKQQRRRAGDLDVSELVEHSVPIKESLQKNLKNLTTGGFGKVMADDFTLGALERSRERSDQCIVATQIWARAALIYLFVIVSGWQPTSPYVRSHVGRVIELLTDHAMSHAQIRTMVWPFSVAGFFAVSDQEAQIRRIVDTLQPQSFFGTVRKALELMENVWRDRGAKDIESRDIASCFRSSDGLVLLV